VTSLFGTLYLLTLLALLPSIAHAQPITREWQGDTLQSRIDAINNYPITKAIFDTYARGYLSLPPFEYDVPYKGKLIIIESPTLEGMKALCNRPDAKTACAWPPLTIRPDGTSYRYECVIIMVPLAMLVAQGHAPRVVLRHEIGHCNGWTNHASATAHTTHELRDLEKLVSWEQKVAKQEPSNPEPEPPEQWWAPASIVRRTLPDGTVAIFLTGRITLSYYSKFLDVANGVKTGVVILDSMGGDSGAAISIGRYVRAFGYRTAVYSGSRCDSACPLIWLAGTSRHLDPDAHLGFHSARRRSMLHAAKLATQK
jgi:hypothetical protein